MHRMFLSVAALLAAVNFSAGVSQLDGVKHGAALLQGAHVAPDYCRIPGTSLPTPNSPFRSAQIVPSSVARFTYADVRLAGDAFPDSVDIGYDDGSVHTWWCSDKDSFGAAVEFTPREYPCEVIAGVAPIHYDMAANIFLRVYDASGPGGYPGVRLAEVPCSGVPHNADSSFKEYGLVSPIRIDSGDFYVCFWQKSFFNLIFASDLSMDSMSRQIWFLPPTGWMRPVGMDAADHLIRARVSYTVTGVEEELEPAKPARPGADWFTLGANPAQAGILRLESSLACGTEALVRVCDAAGRVVRKLTVDQARASVDLSGLMPGVYVVQLSMPGKNLSRKLILR